MEKNIIANALHAYLVDISQRGGKNRHFFQLNGFDENAYKQLLRRLQADKNRLAGRDVIVRTIKSIPGYKEYTLEKGKSAAWYRNNVQKKNILILIINGNTSEAQSLQDIFSVNQTILATTGLKFILNATFAHYPLSPKDVIVIEKFLVHLRKAVFEPQLSNLIEFLNEIDRLLAGRQANDIQHAITLSLPYLELFRCQSLAKDPQLLTSARVEPILRDIHRAARLGAQELDNRERNIYLDRLEKAEFDDDSAYGNLSNSEKKEILRRFLNETVTHREERVDILKLDWDDVKNVLSKKTHPRHTDQIKALAKSIESTLTQQEFVLAELPDYIHDILRVMLDGKDANSEQIERLTNEYQEFLGKQLSNSLRRLVKKNVRNFSDFIVAITIIAIELLNPLQTESQKEAFIDVTFLNEQFDMKNAKEREALRTFRALYGGIEQIMPSVRFNFTNLWALANGEGNMQALIDFPLDKDTNKEFTVLLKFRVNLCDVDGKEINPPIDFNWIYHSDSPAAATFACMLTEKKRFNDQEAISSLFSAEKPAPSIPIYNKCTVTDDIRDLDLYRPRHSLGAWYEKPSELRQLLSEQLQGRISEKELLEIEHVEESLENAWKEFIYIGADKGLLESKIDNVLDAYDHLLHVCSTSWKGGTAASRGYRVLTQAWMISPIQQTSQNPWVIMCSLHPLKLLWWQERARRFNRFISDLLNPSIQTSAVDETLFRRELPSLYGSSGFPAIIAQPIKEGWPEFFLPVEEIEGYELYRLSSSVSETYGSDVERLEELEDEEAETKRAAGSIAHVIKDYIETYPFIRDGIEIVLLQCRNASFPELLVEHLTQLAGQKNWHMSISIIIHTEDRGAPLFRRVSSWLNASEKWTERNEDAYFPLINLKVLECTYEELFYSIKNSKMLDIVVLTDLLEEKGQKIERDWMDETPQDIISINYLPVYHAQQEPFEKSESNRTITLNQPPYPALVRRFYNMQLAAQRRGPVKPDRLALFQKMFGLQDWEQVLDELHSNFNWVVCYDPTVDRFLLESTFPQTVQVIRYSLGLGIKRQHNLTVSSSKHAQDVVIRRLTVRLSDILKKSLEAYDFMSQVAQCLVKEAKQVSGDIVLRAAGPGSYLNELIGLVVAKYLTEQRYLTTHTDALTTWIYLDDFGHWFRGKYPDLLFVAIPPVSSGKTVLHLEVLETKCIGQDAFDSEVRDAQRQTVLGVNRLTQAWMPGKQHLDSDYWYDQLYRAVVGNISINDDQKEQWNAFRDSLLSSGDFEIDISGHSWIFCHDSSVVIASNQYHEEGNFNFRALDAQSSNLIYHHYGRAGLRKTLLDLVEHQGQVTIPSNIGHEEEEKKTPQI